MVLAGIRNVRSLPSGNSPVNHGERRRFTSLCAAGGLSAQHAASVIGGRTDVSVFEALTAFVTDTRVGWHIHQSSAFAKTQTFVGLLIGKLIEDFCIFVVSTTETFRDRVNDNTNGMASTSVAEGRPEVKQSHRTDRQRYQRQ